MIHCDKCGVVPVNDPWADFPVTLPERSIPLPYQMILLILNALNDQGMLLLKDKLIHLLIPGLHGIYYVMVTMILVKQLIKR